MRDIEQIKCPKCGYKNIKMTRKCTRCHYKLDLDNKSCPKCGRINLESIEKCECGFNFNKKKRSLFYNMIISLIVMIIMLLLYKFGGFSDKYNIALKVIVLFAVFVVIVKTFSNVKGEEISYSAETEMIENLNSAKKMKLISNISIIVGAILVVCFLIYYYIFR